MVKNDPYFNSLLESQMLSEDRLNSHKILSIANNFNEPYGYNTIIKDVIHQNSGVIRQQ